MNKLYRYCLSMGNLTGLGAISLVALLHGFGVFPALWWLIAAASYGICVMAWQERAPDELPQGLETMEYVGWLKGEVLGRLPAEAQAVLRRILDVVDEIWPRLKDLEAEGLVQLPNRMKLKQTLTQLLPAVLRSYLKLPALYAKTVRIDGDTPQALLVKQLILVEDHLNDIRQGVYSKDVDALLRNGDFLQATLKSQSGNESPLKL